MTRLWRQDLAWAGLILVIASGIGLWQGQRLIPLSKELWQLQAQMDERSIQHQHMKTIALPRAYDMFQEGQALFIDARPASQYAEMHIPRALNLPAEELEKTEADKVAGIAKNRDIVVYCASADCDLALMVTEKLESLGFTQVVIFWDGMASWEKSGYPVAKSGH